MTIPLIIIAMAGCLRLLGRRWWCSCGRPAPWTSAVTSGCNSQHVADPYSATHLQHGLGFYLLLWALRYPLSWLVMAVVFIDLQWTISPESWIWVVLQGLADVYAGAWDNRFAVIVLLEAIFECVENTNWSIQRFRKQTISRGYTGDAIANSVGDTLCCLAGAWYGSVVPIPASIVLALAIEFGLLLTIRDSLVVNIVMLVHPIEWLKRWQNS